MYWVHFNRIHVEQFEGPALQPGRLGGHGGAVLGVVRQMHGVQRQFGQVVQQCGQAVRGQAHGGALGGAFAPRPFGGSGRLHGRGPLRAGAFGVLVLEQHRGQPPSQVPLHMAGQGAQEHVGADPPGAVHVHRTDFEPGLRGDLLCTRTVEVKSSEWTRALWVPPQGIRQGGLGPTTCRAGLPDSDLKRSAQSERRFTLAPRLSRQGTAIPTTSGLAARRQICAVALERSISLAFDLSPSWFTAGHIRRHRSREVAAVEIRGSRRNPRAVGPGLP